MHPHVLAVKGDHQRVHRLGADGDKLGLIVVVGELAGPFGERLVERL